MSQVKTLVFLEEPPEFCFQLKSRKGPLRKCKAKGENESFGARDRMIRLLPARTSRITVPDSGVVTFAEPTS
jgi:hypothetical protein